MKNEGIFDLRMRTKQFALRIVRLYSSLPKSTAAQVMGKQLLRSGTSVGANYREGLRARSDAEFVAKLGIVLQELDETDYWLDLLGEANILPKTRLSDLKDETNQLLSIMTTIVKNKKATMKNHS